MGGEPQVGALISGLRLGSGEARSAAREEGRASCGLQGKQSRRAPAGNRVRAPGYDRRGSSFKNESSTSTWLETPGSCTGLVGS